MKNTHIAQQGASGYMTTNPLIYYSVSPLHNFAGSFGANFSTLGGFEEQTYWKIFVSQQIPQLSQMRQTGTNGSYVRTTSDGSPQW